MDTDHVPGQMDEGLFRGHELHRIAKDHALNAGTFLEGPNWEAPLGILHWAATQGTFTFAELADKAPVAVRARPLPELLAWVEVLRVGGDVVRIGMEGKMCITKAGAIIAEAVATTQDRDDYLDALVFLLADTWEVAFAWLTAALDLGPVFTLTDVIEEFAAWPIPLTMEECTEIRVRELLTDFGVIAEGGAGLMEITKAGRAIALAMRDEVDDLREADAKVPDGAMRQAREERRRKQGRPGAV